MKRTSVRGSLILCLPQVPDPRKAKGFEHKTEGPGALGKFGGGGNNNRGEGTSNLHWKGTTLVLNFPQQGIKACGQRGREPSWHKRVITNSCSSSSPYLNSSLLRRYILFFINPDFSPNKFDAKRQQHDFSCPCPPLSPPASLQYEGLWNPKDERHHFQKLQTYTHTTQHTAQHLVFPVPLL